jgi:K+-sensing histidine kinase KdpD
MQPCMPGQAIGRISTSGYTRAGSLSLGSILDVGRSIVRTSKDDNSYQTFTVGVLSKVALLLSAHALSVLRGAFAGMFAVVLLTYCGYHLQLNLASENSLYLLAVVLVSLFGGFWEATLTSVAAAACLTYFFVPPPFTFNITDGGNFVSVVAFEATAIIVGRLFRQSQATSARCLSERK